MTMTAYRDITFGTRKAAYQTLLDMNEIIRKYGYASEADLYDSAGKDSSYNMLKRGWTNLNEAYVHPIRGGYILMMPPLENLDDVKEKNMDPNNFDSILFDAAMRRHTGYLQINGARVPVAINDLKLSTDEPAVVECEVRTTSPRVSYKKYCQNDVEEMHRLVSERKREFLANLIGSGYGKNDKYGPQIKDVIFSPPATIVFWKDNTKTVVKAEGEEYDPEKGLAMAIAKKTLGNKHDYYNTFKKWLKKAPKTDAKYTSSFMKGVNDYVRVYQKGFWFDDRCHASRFCNILCL